MKKNFIKYILIFFNTICFIILVLRFIENSNIDYEEVKIFAINTTSLTILYIFDKYIEFKSKNISK